MADVVIYKFTPSMYRKLAHMPEVQAGLDATAYRLSVQATARLKGPYSEGYSYITIGSGMVDRAVIVNDPDTPGNEPAAWQIALKALHGAARAEVVDDA